MPDDLTPDRLAELRRIVEAMTPGDLEAAVGTFDEARRERAEGERG